jgi:ribonuclease HIII
MKNTYKFKVGDNVIVSGGKIGKITKRYKQCPQDDEWINNQIIPITKEELKLKWYSVKLNRARCDKSGKGKYFGSICTDESSINYLNPYEKPNY